MTARDGSDWLRDGGEMGEALRAHDWPRTPLGPLDAWPAELRTAVGLVLSAGVPAILLWSESLTVAALNDAYRALPGQTPPPLGGPALEAWPAARPALERALAGEAASLAAPPGHSFSPVRDGQGQVAGVLGLAVAPAPAELEERLRLALEIGRLATWDWNLDTGEVAWSDEHYRMLGYAVGEVTPSYEAWISRVHPDDRAAAEAALVEARDQRRDFVQQFRATPPDGPAVWCSVRGRFFYDEAGRPCRMVGVMEDATDQHVAQQTQATLLAELQHRTRNQLAVIRSIVRRTAEASEDLEDFLSHFEGRLGAFARTQAALTRSVQVSINLESLLRDEFLAAVASDQVEMEGPDVRLFGKAAEAVALAVHELVTNAVKYGALSTPQGRVKVVWTLSLREGGGVVALDWSETGVPLVDVNPARRGFGRRLLEEALPYELGAATELRFAPGGVRARIEVPLSPPGRLG